MDGISEKIKEILSDEESMQQLRELAELLGGAPPADDNSGSGGFTAECFDPDEKERSAAQGTGMPDIGELMSMFSGGQTPMGFDMGSIMKIAEIMQTTSANDDNRAFLLALRPLLGEDKQRRIDKAVKMLRLYAVFRAMQKSGMLSRLEDIF